jgi:membrane protein DedA with SNARE-associated domain
VKAGAGGLSGWLALAVLLPMEAGVPIPIPADLVMFTVGERVAAGAFPLWLAVAGFEIIAVTGTAALFLACRGPAHGLVTRFGPRIGLSQARVSRGAAFVDRRGRSALAIGRGTPGLRTVTVLAAAASGLGWRRALPALVLGSSVFLQLHLVLGLLLGPLAVQAFNAAKGPALLALVLLLAGAFVFWRVRRGRRGGSEAWAEAACPVCVGPGLISYRVPGLAGLMPPAAAPAGEGDDPPAVAGQEGRA